MFKIDALNLHWINGKQDDANDLCLHGDVIAKIGTEIFKYDCTVSATALLLLKTLTEDHIINTSTQMLPCCGHFLIANHNLDNVEILGCCNGIDWSVIHEQGKIKIVTETNKTTIVDMYEYEEEVFAFADKIKNFYKKCSPKKINIDDIDDFDKNGYIAFWNEWHKRRNSKTK